MANKADPSGTDEHGVLSISEEDLLLRYIYDGEKVVHRETVWRIADEFFRRKAERKAATYMNSLKQYAANGKAFVKSMLREDRD